MMESEAVFWLGRVGFGVVLAAVMTFSALLQRTSPIRLRHWGHGAGGALSRMVEDRRRFAAYRLVLSLGPWATLLAWIALEGGTGRTLTIALVAVLVAEGISRWIVDWWAETVLERLTPAYRFFELLTRPVCLLLAVIMPGEIEEEEEDQDDASEAEIDAYIDVGRREGVLEVGEMDLLRSILEFAETQVRSVMTPRVDLVCAPIEAAAEELLDLMVESGHSRVPLYRDSIDAIVGVVHIRDVARALRQAEPVHQHVRVPHFVPETKLLSDLLEELQARHQELAIVVDEYGGTGGLVTTEDLLEEIFGEIVDEHDEEETEIEALPDGSWRLDGRVHVDELEEILGAPLPDAEYETVGGLILDILGRVPRVGEQVRLEGHSFTVEAADERRVRQVRLVAASGEAMPEEAEDVGEP